MQENIEPAVQNEPLNTQINIPMPASTTSVVRENAFKYPEEQKAPVQFSSNSHKINPLILILFIIIFLLGLGIVLWKFVFGSNVDFLNALRTAPSPTVAIVPPSATPTNGRIVLTPNNIQQYNGKTIQERCEEKFNADAPNEKVMYINKKMGISFEIPFNKIWGNDKYAIHPFDEIDKDGEIYQVNFGNLIMPKIAPRTCDWVRSYYVKFLPAKTAEQILSENKDNKGCEIHPVESTSSGDLQGVKYGGILSSCMRVIDVDPVFQLIGKRYNYEFGALNADLTEIINTVKLIE